jgi:hypothetical protein
MLMGSVKLLVLITISTLFSQAVFSQLKLPFNNPIQNDIEQILKDYSNQFKNIRAEELSQDPQITGYRSAIVISGAEECSVIKYSAKKKEVYSWQALMMTTEDFETAKKKFKILYSQLNNLAAHFDDNQVFYFKGNYESPSEGKKFTSTILSAEPDKESVKNLKIELTMEYELLEWKIKILVYGREREDDERGETKEGG